MKAFFQDELAALANTFTLLAEQSDVLERISNLCTEALRRGNKILFCGNGGSAADAQHLAAEFVGRYKLNRPAMASIALTVDTSILTAVGNDFGYDEVFSRQTEALGKAGDVLIGISTSGNSENVVRAMRLAAQMGIATVAFTGSGGGKMASMADIALCVPSATTNHIQEMHITAGHLICECVEREIHGEKAQSPVS